MDLIQIATAATSPNLGDFYTIDSAIYDGCDVDCVRILSSLARYPRLTAVNPAGFILTQATFNRPIAQPKPAKPRGFIDATGRIQESPIKTYLIWI